MWVSTSTRKWIARAVVVVLPVLALTVLPTQAADCQFILGFATLKALIDEVEGPDKVGECLEDQRFNPLNGDALQQTTGGLMVWRKLDNWTAFTDGYRTWINGPHGLQARLNTETFDWEASPPPAPTSVVDPLADYGAWQFADYTDLLTDVTEHRAILEAEQRQGYSGVLPDLIVRCYVGDTDRLHVVIIWNTRIGRYSDVPEGYHAISYRFGEELVVDDFQGVSSTNDEATYMVVNSANGFYRSLFDEGHRKLAVKVARYDGLGVTALWDITGAVYAHNRVLESCGW